MKTDENVSLSEGPVQNTNTQRDSIDSNDQLLKITEIDLDNTVQEATNIFEINP